MSKGVELLQSNGLPNPSCNARLVSESTRVCFSFIIDRPPIFAYQGWHLAHSLATHCAVKMGDVHIHFTPEVPVEIVELFREIGVGVHRLERLGDGRYCNKIGQWDNLRDVAETADRFVFLDTDTICVANLLEQIPKEVVSAKVVDFDNPNLGLLDELFHRAGFLDRPAITPVDCRDALTYVGNCNGGMYSVPTCYAEELFGAWKRIALDLLAKPEPLRRVGKENHIDQIAFCMALHKTSIAFAPAPSNVNFLHAQSVHRFWDANALIALLHYHHSLDVGRLQPEWSMLSHEAVAVAEANTQFSRRTANLISSLSHNKPRNWLWRFLPRQKG